MDHQEWTIPTIVEAPLPEDILHEAIHANGHPDEDATMTTGGTMDDGALHHLLEDDWMTDMDMDLHLPAGPLRP